MKKNILILLLLYVTSTVFYAQGIDKSLALFEYYNNSKNVLEGYSLSIGYNDFSYHSLRDDVTECLLIRCKEGINKAEWYTTSVPEGYNRKFVSFGWINAIDMTALPALKVDVYVNDVKRFEVPFTKKYNWKIENPDGSALSFDACELDRYNDAHGFMTLKIPAEWCEPGKSVKITAVAAAANSNSWWIIYKAKDALSALRNMVKNNIELTLYIDNEKNQIVIKASDFEKGKEFKYELNNKRGNIILKEIENYTGGVIDLTGMKLAETSFIFKDDASELINTKSLADIKAEDKIVGQSVQRVENVPGDGKNTYKIRRLFAPYAAEAVKKLAFSKTSGGQIYLMNSSHQDIAWMDTPEKCVIERDTMLITPLLKKASTDPNYRFELEDALMLKEYVTRHPDKIETIKKLLHNGQLACGSSFNMPYEEIFSGESLIRQFYFGTRWLKKEFDYDAQIYWNVDVPGRTLQMPQIAKKAGTNYMVISRQEEGVYNWFSPDGSYVTVYTPGHYGDAMNYLTKDFFGAAPAIAQNCLRWEKYFNGKSVVPILSDNDMSPAKDYSGIISKWENIKEIIDNGKSISVSLPKIKVASALEFFQQFIANAKEIPSIKGERPAVWLYIQHPSHKEAIDASREGDILLAAAEKFSSVRAMLEGNNINYPLEELDKAWEAKIYPDHGWGGKGGDITDAEFKAKFIYAKEEGERILFNTLNAIAPAVKTDKKKGIPILAFNSLSWNRTAPVDAIIQFPEGSASGIKIFDADGKEINCNLKEIQNYKDGTIKQADVEFIALNVPSIGYKTYYAKGVKQINDKTVSEKTDKIENEYYLIELSDKGIKRIYDKELKKELLDVSKFYGGEIFSMKSVGEDAGEFADIQHPTMEGFDHTSAYNIKWEPVKKCGIYSSVKFRQQIKNAVIEEELILYNNIKKIDLNAAILNWEGVMFREFRIAFPLNMNDGQVTYEVPFGAVNVGKDELAGAAGERYTVPCKDMHPRGIQNWISASNNSLGVTISTSAGVVDYIDPTTNPVSQQIIQPILLASRRSCHGEGPEYPQTGDHYYHFSITSHAPGWQNGAEYGIEGNEPLYVVVNPSRYEKAKLSEELSFFSTNSKNVIVTTIKKAEEGNGFIVRLYENEGKNTHVNLKSFININEIYSTDIIENNEKVIFSKGKDINIAIGKNAIETFLIK